MPSTDTLRSLESSIMSLNIGDDASQADTIGCGPVSETAAHFSELMMLVCPETSAFCLSLLWILREKRVVQNWFWEDGILRVWADMDFISRVPSVPDCAGACWLLQLIQTTQHEYEGTCPMQLREPFYCGEDEATDFSFLCSGPRMQPV